MVARSRDGRHRSTTPAAGSSTVPSSSAQLPADEESPSWEPSRLLRPLISLLRPPGSPSREPLVTSAPSPSVLDSSQRSSAMLGSPALRRRSCLCDVVDIRLPDYMSSRPVTLSTSASPTPCHHILRRCRPPPLRLHVLASGLRSRLMESITESIRRTKEALSAT
jgi:hypothetical protein